MLVSISAILWAGLHWGTSGLEMAMFAYSAALIFPAWYFLVRPICEIRLRLRRPDDSAIVDCPDRILDCSRDGFGDRLDNTPARIGSYDRIRHILLPQPALQSPVEQRCHDFATQTGYAQCLVRQLEINRYGINLTVPIADARISAVIQVGNRKTVISRRRSRHPKHSSAACYPFGEIYSLKNCRKNLAEFLPVSIEAERHRVPT